MASPRKASPSKGQNQRKTPKLKSAEKLAVSQEIKVEDLLHDFLRQELAPDPNDGNSYYLGKVLDISDSSQNFNIFNDSISNMERFYSNYKTSEKLDGKTLLVHIPELYSTNDFTREDSLSTYTKFKINYYGESAVKKDDILKIVFKNNNSFKDPEIISIFRSDGNENYEVERQRLLDSFQSYRECRVLQISGSNASTLDLNNSYLATPVAGYYQLFNELNFILSNDGFKTFIREQGPNTNITFQQISQITYKIYADLKVKAKVEQTKLQNNIFQDSEAKPAFEERSDFEVLLRLNYNDVNTLKKFASFIDQKLSKFNFFSNIGSPAQLEGTKTFYLDISIDIQAVVGSNLDDVNVDKYLEFSEARKSGPSPSSSPATVQSSQTTETTLQQNTTPDACENAQPAVVDLYISTENKQKWTRNLFDSQFVDHFLKLETNVRLPIDYVPLRFPIKTTDDILQFENLKISGEKVNKKDSIVSYTFQELQKKNPKFYNIPQKILQKNEKEKLSIGIKSNYKDPQKTNYVSEKSLNFRIEQISNFLKNLKDLISQNEQVSSTDVLILPLNVVRANTGGNSDTESRHYYGQAVDFVVYVKLPNISNPNKPLIFQIPPIVVYFYCRKLAERQQFVENSGNGIFINESYNHFEFLFFPGDEEIPRDIKSGLTEDERKNGRLWVVGSNDDALKNIDKLKNSEKHKVLRDYLNANYARVGSGNPVQKILRLL